MTVIELMLALLILTVALLSAFTVFDSSKRSTHVSETQEGEIHQAQRELERLESLSYAQLGLTAAPATSTSRTNPDYYVTATPSGSCPSFTWNQSSGATAADALVVNGCNSFSGGTIAPVRTSSASGYTIYDFITWVTDPNCNASGGGCPTSNDYKRITVEVTNALPSTVAPTAPALVSAVMADPHSLPVGGYSPYANNPLNDPTVTCTNGSGQQVTCNNGLGGQSPNTYYLTDSLEQGTYTAPTGNNACMHYTDAVVPLTCGGGTPGLCTTLTGQQGGCPQPDLLSPNAPPSSISQEYNFSPNLSGTTPGRVISRDPKATSCTATPSNDASMSEFFATKPLSTQLNLSGSGGMTLYTSTLKGVATSVTVCAAVYLETPVLGILDPLNLLGTSDSVRLGVVSYTLAQWPGVLTPVSMTFNYMSAAQLAAAGSSIGVRLWVTASSLDDIVLQYDAPTVSSTLQINSQ